MQEETWTSARTWSVWLVFHIWILIGFRNRPVVLINWAWDYLLYDRAVRLIMRPEREPREDAAAPISGADDSAP